MGGWKKGERILRPEVDKFSVTVVGRSFDVVEIFLSGISLSSRVPTFSSLSECVRFVPSNLMEICSLFLPPMVFRHGF